MAACVKKGQLGTLHSLFLVQMCINLIQIIKISLIIAKNWPAEQHWSGFLLTHFLISSPKTYVGLAKCSAKLFFFPSFCHSFFVFSVFLFFARDLLLIRFIFQYQTYVGWCHLFFIEHESSLFSSYR